jgi:hypothetical protein
VYFWAHQKWKIDPMSGVTYRRTRHVYDWTRQLLRKMLRWSCASEGGEHDRNISARSARAGRAIRAGALGGLVGDVWPTRDLRVGAEEG